MKNLPKLETLERQFYERPTPTVARELVGHYLARRIIINEEEHLLEGQIVETEAYGGMSEDQASHAYRGMTRRNTVMFGLAGVAYVYFTYGNHFCFNVSARSDKQSAGAVLIRSIRPTAGINIMQALRKKNEIQSLTSGPGKLTQALQISLDLNGADLTSRESEVYIRRGRHRPSVIACTPRIGITRALDRHWRFVDSTSAFLSRSLPRLSALL